MSEKAFDLDVHITSVGGGQKAPASISGLVTRALCTRVTCRVTSTCVCTSLCTSGLCLNNER